MNEALYDDGKIAVTRNEVRAKGFVLYLDSVSSISVETVRPGRWPSLLMVAPILALLGLVLFVKRWFTSTFGPLMGQQPPALSILPFFTMLPLCAGLVLAFLFRISRLLLLTTGGPVVLASKISLTEPHDTISRYKTIRGAIENAISLRKR
ncbi:MAG: hypothetical protein ABSF95_14330 [Verrucomicrobiota bacterium]|jgi:hypothetical protein